MLALLFFFLLLRRRITRVTSRRMDQETGFGRGGQVSEVGKGGLSEEPAGSSPVWSMKGKELPPQSPMGPGPQDKEGSIMWVFREYSVDGVLTRTCRNPIPTSLVEPISTPGSGSVLSPASFFLTDIKSSERCDTNRLLQHTHTPLRVYIPSPSRLRSGILVQYRNMSSRLSLPQSGLYPKSPTALHPRLSRSHLIYPYFQVSSYPRYRTCSHYRSRQLL